MRIMNAIVLGTIVAASPAAAAGGLSCRPVRGAGPMIDVAAGHAMVPAILGVTLREGGKVMTAGAINNTGNHALVVGQAWYDAREVRLDLLDARLVRFEGKLRVRFGTGSRGHVALGSFSRNGRTYQVRCTGEMVSRNGAQHCPRWEPERLQTVVPSRSNVRFASKTTLRLCPQWESGH